MNALLRNHADQIIRESIAAVLPDEAVRRTLKDYRPGRGRTILVAAGKAAWQMAKAAVDTLGHVDDGVVITKYKHVKSEIPGLRCFEAGHPVPDENSFAATREALELVENLKKEDTVIFLLSGGGSALFELPLIPGEELQDITRQLLASGAEIVEINTEGHESGLRSWYCCWSLLDNFEWQKGFSMTFGLIAVDRDTQERRAKESLTVLGSYAAR